MLQSLVRVLPHLREPLLVASRSGQILAANPAGAEALGTSMEGLASETLASYCPEPVDLDRHVRDPSATRAFPIRARDGRAFVCDATAISPDLVLLRLSGGPAAEPRVRQFFETLLQLHGLAGKPPSTQSLAERARELLATWMTRLGVVAGGVFVLDASGTNLELAGEVRYPAAYAARFRLVPLSTPLPLTEAVKRRVPILIGTTEAYQAQFPELVRTHPDVTLRGMACVPIELDGRCLGVVGLGVEMPRVFTDADRAGLGELADEVAQAIAHARAEDADSRASALAERSASQLARMQAFTGALAKAITPVQVTEAVTDMGMTAASARSGGLWLLSPDGALACLARAVGPTGPRPENHTGVPLDGPMRMPILDSIRDGTPVWIESCRQFEERYPEMYRVCARGGESSLACVPLFANGRCIGGLALNYEGTHEFFEDERAFLQVLAWYSAQAIERARQYAAEQRARQVAETNQRRSDFLAEISMLLGDSLDYESTLAAVAAAAVPGVADWCIVELAEQRVEGQPAVAAHTDPSKVAFVLELSRRYREVGDTTRGIPGVLRSGKSELYPHVTPEALASGIRDDRELVELYAKTGIVSSMVVPITARGCTLGAVLLNSCQRIYDEQDLAMAEELGRRAGLAVDNARLYRDARRADRLKDEFLAMVSHELRNPLAPIVTALAVMDLSRDQTFSRERAIIARQIKHVTRLVGDLLDVARITHGKIQLDLERTEIARVIAKSVETASSFVEDRGHVVSVSVAPTGLPVDGDLVRLSQAITNLLTNAAKYTEPGGTIEVVAAVEGADVVVRVRDNGIGIPPEMLPVIFDRFVQDRSSIERSHGGLGLGLTIVKRLVELHHGRVSARSEGRGKGSEFTIHLPLATGMEVAIQPGASAMQPPPEGRRRVLVVDDNHDAAEMLCVALGSLGYETRMAHDGDTALALAAEFEPQLTLLDIGLPVMNGLELANRIRRLPGSAGTRLVAVTGYGQESDVERSRAAGFDEHVVKPIDLDTLRGILERYRAAGVPVLS